MDYSAKKILLFSVSAFVLTYVVLRYMSFGKPIKKEKLKSKKNKKASGRDNGDELDTVEQLEQKSQYGDDVQEVLQCGQELTMREAVALTKYLNSTDINLLQKVLVTLSNASAFKVNQDILRETECLTKLQGLLEKHSMAMQIGDNIAYPGVVSSITTTINNLAMNQDNQKHLQGCIPALMDFATCDKSTSIQLASLQALTNLSVTSDYHAPYTQVIQQLYDILDTGSHSLRLQALKILVNLSCNGDMVPHLLAARAPKCTLTQLSADSNTAHLLRWTTVLSNILSTGQHQRITSTALPCEYKAASPETLYAALYGVDNTAKLKSKVFVLCKHGDEDVRGQAAKMYAILT